MHAIDFSWRFFLRFEPHNKNDDETKKKLRHDISLIVRAFENKSKTICENCSEEGIIRMDMLGKGHFVMSAIIIILKSLMKDRENNK